MSNYVAPVREMMFAMNELAGLEEICGLPGNEEVSGDLVEAILDEAGKFATEFLAPINPSGDRQGNKWADGVVTTADGFKEAYSSFCETGLERHAGLDRVRWTRPAGDGVDRGAGDVKSANMSFSLCQMLTLGAVEAIAHHGPTSSRTPFSPTWFAGTWTGTMNLTEPQAAPIRGGAHQGRTAR